MWFTEQSANNIGRISVPGAPVITANPANLVVISGGTATFTAAATGTPTPTVQWQVSSDGGATFNFIWDGNASVRGVNRIMFDPSNPTIIYGAAYQQGVWRSTDSATCRPTRITARVRMGRGEVIDSPCPSCNGTGRVTRERTLSVNIPPGVEDGTRIRLAGEGEAGVRGGPTGDLYIFLSLAAHPLFQRDGADLHCRVPISMVTAALGGDFEVPSIDGGKTRVKVPAGTQSGRRFRLSSKGMPVLRSKQLGDMYVQVVVETPQNLTKKQRDLLAEFDKLSSKDTQPESTGFFSKLKDFFGNGTGAA